MRANCTRDPQDVVGLYAGVDHGEKPLNVLKDVACFTRQFSKLHLIATLLREKSKNIPLRMQARGLSGF